MGRTILIAALTLLVCSCSQEWLERRRARVLEAQLRARMGDREYEEKKKREEARRRQASFEPAESPAEALLKEAGRMERAGKYTEAILCLNEYLRIESSPEVMLRRDRLLTKEMGGFGRSKRASWREENPDLAKELDAPKVPEGLKARLSCLAKDLDASGWMGIEVKYSFDPDAVRTGTVKAPYQSLLWSRCFKKTTPATHWTEKRTEYTLVIPFLRREMYAVNQEGESLCATMSFAVAKLLGEVTGRGVRVDLVRVSLVNPTRICEMTFLTSGTVRGLGLSIDGIPVSRKPWTPPGLALVKKFIKDSF